MASKLQPPNKIYVKKNAVTNKQFLSAYTDDTAKIICYDKFKRKVCIGKCWINKRLDGVASNMLMEISIDELHALATYLMKPGSQNVYEDVVIHKKEENSKQQILVLTRDQWGLKLIHRKGVYEDDDGMCITDNEHIDEDAEPIDIDNMPADVTLGGKIAWEEVYGSFHFKSNDDLQKMGQKMMEVHENIKRTEHFVNSFSTDSSDVVTIDDEQSNKRKLFDDDDDEISHGKEKRKKSRKNKKLNDNEVMGLCLLFSMMKKTKEELKECCLKYSNILNEELMNMGYEKVDFIYDILKKFREDDLKEIYKEKINKF